MRIALGVATGVLVLIAGFAVFLERTIESDAFQAALREEIEAALAGSPEWADVEWAGTKARLVSSSLALEQPRLRLGRDVDGRTASSLRWLAESGEAKLDPAWLLVGRARLQSLTLSRGALEFRGRRHARPFAWRLDDLDLLVGGENGGGDGPFPFRFSGRLPGGATDSIPISAEGRFTSEPDAGVVLSTALDFGSHGRARIEVTRIAPGSPFELLVSLESFDLALLSKAFEQHSVELAGRATGSVEVGRGQDARAPDRVEIDVRVVDADLWLPEYDVEGVVSAFVTIEDPFSNRARGRLELELTDARFDLRGQFEKPVGQGASVTTTFGPDGAGGTDFETRVSLRDLHQILTPGEAVRAVD